MAQLRDSIITGDLRVTGTIYGNVPLNDLTDADDLKAIEGLSGTSGWLKKTAANTWALGTLAASDIPNIDVGKITSGTLPIARGGTGLTASPSMLTNLGSTTAENVLQASPRPGITGTLGAANGGTGKTTLKDSANALINALDTGSSNLTSNDYVITQYVGGGTATTTYHRRPASALRVGGLLTARKLTIGSTGKNFDGTADVSWTLAEIGAAASNHNHDSTYVNVSGDTMTGALNFANGTYNNIGDDVQIGDVNKAGRLGIKGLNGATGIEFVPYSGSTSQSFTIDGNNMATLTGDMTITGDRIRFGNGTAAYLIASTPGRTDNVLLVGGGKKAAGDVNGTAIRLGAGGLTLIGGGEYANNRYNVADLNDGTEQLYLGSDTNVYIETNAQTIESRKTFTFDSNGILTVPNGVSSPAIELSGMSTSANSGGYIDFHWNNSSDDFTSRIIENANHSLQFRTNQMQLYGTGSFLIANSAINASLANNNVSSVQYPAFYITDNAARVITRLESIIWPNGDIGSQWYIRNYNTSGTSVAQKGIKMVMNKSGTLTWTVDEAENFRTAIGSPEKSVLQSNATANKWRKVTLGSQYFDNINGTVTEQTGQLYINSQLEFNTSAGTLKATEYSVNGNATLQYNSTTESLDFVF